MTCCFVPKCKEVGVHRFPKNKKILKRWLKALRRNKSSISLSSRLCGKHFLESDYEKYSECTGLPRQRKVLRRDAVPSIFPWRPHLVSDKPTDREKRLRIRNIRKKLCHDVDDQSVDILPQVPGVKTEYNVLYDLDVSQEILNLNSDSLNESDIENKSTCTGTQTPSLSKLFSTDLLITDGGATRILVLGRLGALQSFIKEKL